MTWTLTQTAQHMLNTYERKYCEEYVAEHKRGDPGVRMEQFIQGAKHPGGH